MGDFLSKLFDTSDFPPRWHCGSWSDFLGWLHIGSDLAIFAAYFTIPLLLIAYMRKRDDIPQTRVFWLFAAFIFTCGTVHLVEAIIFWQPIYRVSGLLKLTTAVVSWATVLTMIAVIPKVLHWPSLAQTNERLEQEIAQRRKAETDLQRIMARQAILLSGTSSIVWTTNPEGEFIEPQESWERYTGQTWEEHRGRGWLNAIHEDDRAELLRHWSQVLKKGGKYEHTGCIWHQASDAYHSFIAEAVPIYAASGEIAEWVGTIKDVEHEQAAVQELAIAQENLVRQKRELELIYEASPQGLCLLDDEHRYLRINKTLAKINGLPVEDHIGKRGSELLPELRDQLEPILRQIFETGQPVLNHEIVGPTPGSNGARTWLTSFYPLMEDLELDSLTDCEDDEQIQDRGKVEAVAAIVQDITERKLQRKQLEASEARALAANQSKSEFLANTSHEIRTPMAAILGYADMLLGNLEDRDNRNSVMVIKRNGEHLLEIINDILDLSRIEAGRFDIELEPCSLSELLGDVQSLMWVRAEAKQLDLKIEFLSPVPEQIETDVTRLRQVLINLIGNAIKFTAQGEVRLAVRWIDTLDPPELEIAVVDTGIGISDEQLDRLFQPFSQGDSSVTRDYGGSGLGLVISQRLITMLGGFLEVNSELGKGSSFIVRLPQSLSPDIALITPQIDADVPAQDDGTETPIQLSCRVLVVDDRRDVRYVSQHFLEKAGAVVIGAENGLKGIRKAKRAMSSGEPFDLILMDMQMPEVDGLQATAELRQAGIEAPIIALTADAMQGDRERCLRGGCDDYLPKPIDHRTLIEMVGRYTQRLTLQDLRTVRKQRANDASTATDP